MSRREARRTPDTEEAAFLAAYDASAFPHPSVAVDVALLSAHDECVLPRHAEILQRERRLGRASDRRGGLDLGVHAEILAAADNGQVGALRTRSVVRGVIR